jgi:lipopolysaccharide export system permease protein
MLRILDRYLLRELAFALIGSAALLLVVTVGGTLSDVLSKVAAGRYPASVMLPVLGLRVLDALSLLLPLALFLGVLLGLARLYRDSEMHVLASSGMGPRGLLRPTLLLTLPVFALVALIALWLGPWASRTSQAMVDAANSSVIAAGLAPGRFVELPGRGGIMFVDRMNAAGNRLTRVFVASERSAPDGRPRVDLVTATHGELYLDSQGGGRFLALFDGHRYQGTLGGSAWKLMRYRRNDIALSNIQGTADDSQGTPHDKTTAQLWGSPTPPDRAELAWRLTAPLSTLVLGLLALPLARQGPREPFYGRMLLALLAYLLYSNLLGIGRAAIMQGRSIGEYALWGVPLLALALALLAFARQNAPRRVPARRPA